MARLLDVAVSAVAAAARAAARVQRGMLVTGPGKLAKADSSPVTIADFAAQAIVTASLVRATAGIPGAPPFALIAEEDAATLREGGAALVDAVVEVLRGSGVPPADGASAADWSPAAAFAALDAGRFEYEAARAALGGTPPSYFILDPVDGTKVR